MLIFIQNLCKKIIYIAGPEDSQCSTQSNCVESDTSNKGTLADGIKLTEGPYIAWRYIPASSNVINADGSNFYPGSEVLKAWVDYEVIDLSNPESPIVSIAEFPFEECNDTSFPDHLKLGRLKSEFRCLNLSGFELQGDVGIIYEKR